MSSPIECPNCHVAGWILECHLHRQQFCESCLNENWTECPTCKGEGFITKAESVISMVVKSNPIGFRQVSTDTERSLFLRCADCGVEAFSVWNNQLYNLNLCNKCSAERWDRRYKQQFKEVRIDLHEWFHKV